MNLEESPTPRDLADYERVYGAHAFEAVQAAFRKRMLLDLLARLQPACVLEIGCGLDTLANHWTEAERFVVVEPGAAFAAQARAATVGRRDVAVLEGLLETVGSSLRAGDYDLILISGLLHELVDCGPLLGAVRSLCDVGTVVHVNVPNAHSFHRLLALEMGLIEDVTAMSGTQKGLQQHRTFTRETLIALVEAHGFLAYETGSYFVKPFTHGQMLDLQTQGFLTPRMLEGLWGMAKHLPDQGSEIYVNLKLAP